MSATLRGDAAFRYTLDGQDYIHYLGHPLHRAVVEHPEQVFEHRSADLSTTRRVRIASTVEDLRAIVKWDGNNDSLARFLKAARAGAALEYFPSLANPSETYPCELVNADQIASDPDLWFDYRRTTQVHLRRTDGGSFRGLVERPLFYYRAGNPLPGLTAARSGTVGPFVDELGVLQSAASDIVRTTWIDGVPHLLLEEARTNLVGSDNFDSGWTSTGTPVVTPGVDDPAGGTDAYTISDDDVTAIENKYYPLTFTGDGTKAVSFVVRENTMPGSGVQYLYVRDVTVGTSRGVAQISGWTNGEPTVSASAGVLLGKVYIGNGYWKIFLQASGVVAANTNRAIVEPAGTASQTGSIDVYRVNAFDSLSPSFSVLNASETRSADSFYASYPHTPRQSISGYIAFVEGGTHAASAGGSLGLLHIGGSGAGSAPRLLVYNNSGSGYAFAYDNGVVAQNTTYSAATPDIGQRVELRFVFDYDPVTETATLLIGQSLEGGAEGTAEYATPMDVPAALAGELIYLNSAGSSLTGLTAIEGVKVVPGVKTMAEMRAL